MKFQNIARRDVLRAAACSAVALPLLQLIRGSRSADAAATAYPRRMIIYATTNSGWPEQFWPRLPGQAPIPKKEAAGWYTSGNTALDTADFTLSPILQPLASHRERMLILEGVDGFDGGSRRLLEFAERKADRRRSRRHAWRRIGRRWTHA